MSREVTRQDLEAAASDAELLVDQSSIVRTLIGTMQRLEGAMATLHLYLAAELEHQWKVENVGLVISVLRDSARVAANRPELLKAGHVLEGFPDVLRVFEELQRHEQDPARGTAPQGADHDGTTPPAGG